MKKESRLQVYRFRKEKFYNEVATAFIGECNINCIYCYSQNQRNTGKFLDADEIGRRLIQVAEKNNIEVCRLSGGDPFNKFEELVKVIDYIVDNSDLFMIIETNGLELGRHPEYSERLSHFPNDRVMVRVCVKHIRQDKFNFLVGESEYNVRDSIDALDHLSSHGVRFKIAWMNDWLTPNEFNLWLHYLVEVGFITPIDYDNFDDWFNSQTNIDVEPFRRYRSVPLSKKEILAELDKMGDIEE